MNAKNTWTYRILASSLLGRSRRAVRYLFYIAWQHATPYESLFTGNKHTMTDYLTKRLTILLHTKRLRYEPWRTRRAQIVCDSDTNHLNNVFIKNYSTDFIERNTYVRPNDSSNNSYTTTATILHMGGTSETIARILRPYNIRVAHKPMFTLRRLLTNVRDKDELRDRPGALYKIKCSNCQATTDSLTGQTGTNVTSRLHEHRRATKKGNLNNNIDEQRLKTSHTIRIDWDSATCSTYSTDYYQRITQEGWFTNLEKTALNRCQPLPASYKPDYSTGNTNTLIIIHLTTNLFA